MKPILAALAGAALLLTAVLAAAGAGRESFPGETSSARITIAMMTSLPLVWGERGAFDPASRPSETWRLLSARFEMRPLDVVSRESLAAADALLLAQPRWLAPGELADIDRWIRDGGGALILADPDLAWPSSLPLGDIRRPLFSSLLGPLLGHWGLTLNAGRSGRHEVRLDGKRLVLESAGRFGVKGRRCTVGPEWLARCRLGKGRAILIADADLARDGVWQGGFAGFGRAENIAVLGDLLESLGGTDRGAANRSPPTPLSTAAKLNR